MVRRQSADNSSWIDALAELRQRATREGYRYQHIQAITVAIDQYAEKALGNRDYFQALRRRLARPILTRTLGHP
jgi:replication-associated recombination protein RarA